MNDCEFRIGNYSFKNDFDDDKLENEANDDFSNMKKADQDVLDLENLRHSEHAVAADNQGDKTASLERLLAATSTTNYEREEAPQDVEKHLLENNMLKTSINDGRHFENVNLNLNNDQTHTAQPKVSSRIDSVMKNI